jgi:hypothetical protein
MEDIAVARFVRRSGRCLVVRVGGGQLRHVLTSVQPKMINIIVIQSNSTGI